MRTFMASDRGWMNSTGAHTAESLPFSLNGLNDHDFFTARANTFATSALGELRS